MILFGDKNGLITDGAISIMNKYGVEYVKLFKNIELAVDGFGDLQHAIRLITHKNLWLIPLYYLLWLPRKIIKYKSNNTQEQLSENDKAEILKNLNDITDKLVKDLEKDIK